MTPDPPTPTPPEHSADNPAPGTDHATALGRLAGKPLEVVRRWKRWRRRKHGRIFRWTVRGIALAVFALVASAIIITQTGLGGRWLLPRLARAYNLRIDAQQSWIASNAQAILTDARVDIPGVAGQAGQVLRAKRVEAQIDWSRLAGGVAAVRAVTIHEPRLRISQDRDTGALNIEGIAIPATSSSTGTAPTLPELFIVNGTLELSEHDQASFAVLRELRFDGTLSPSARGDYLIRLRERDATGRPVETGVMIDGVIDRPFPDGSPGQVKLAIRNPPLSDWKPEQLPSRVRQVVSELQPSGNVTRINIRTGAGPRDDATPRTPSADLVLDGVGLTLPIEPAPGSAATGARPRLRDVTGTVRIDHAGVQATLSGLLNDLPYTIDLDYKGFAKDSPLVCRMTCRDFVVEKNPELLPFVPPEVRKHLQRFSSPTALVSTLLTLSRGTNPQAPRDEVRFEGEMSIRQGRAAFEDFPYEFQDISGRARFSNDEIVFESITGTHPSGATLRADARIAPPTEEAAADIHVVVMNAPIDDDMAKALGPDRRTLLDALFDRPAFDRLTAAGVIDPSFALGGRVDADVRISTPFGRNQPWTTHIDLLFPTLNILPKQCPYPLAGQDVRVRVRNDLATLDPTPFRAPSPLNGTLDLHARFGISAKNNELTIQASADELPALPLLLSPPPGLSPAQADHARAIAQAFNINAPISGTIELTRSDPAGEISLADLTLDLSFEHATLTPRQTPKDAPEANTATSLRVNRGHATLQSARLDVHAVASLSTGPGAPTSGELDLRASTSLETPTPTDAIALELRDYDLTTPIEPFIAAFDPEAGAKLEGRRASLDPSGLVDASVRLPLADPARRGEAELLRARDLAFDGPSGRYALSDLAGTARIEFDPASEDASAFFDHFSAALTQAGDSAGRVTLSGEHKLTSVGPARRGPSTTPISPTATGLEISLDGLVLESQVVSGVVKRILGDESTSVWTDLHPRGTLGGTLRLAPDGSVSGTIVPDRLVLRRDSTDVAFDRLAGSIELSATGGVARGLRIRCEGWSLAIDGAWFTGQGNGQGKGAWEFRGEVAIEADSYSPSLRAALPVEIREVLDDLALRIDGPLSISKGDLVISQDAQGTRRIDWTGTGEMRSAAGKVGIDFKRLSGRFECVASSVANAPAAFDVRIAGESCVIEDASVQNLRVRVHRAAGDPVIRVSTLEGDVHRGRASGSATLTPIDASGDTGNAGAESGGMLYRADIRFAGVRLSPLLDELAAADNTAPVATTNPAPGDPEARALSRGLLDGELSIEGITERKKPSTSTTTASPTTAPTDARAERRGRGSLRVSGGKVLNLPLVLPLIRVSNLQLPNDEPLDYAQARFFIADDLLWFEDLSLFSRALAIEGVGTLSIPDKRLELRFDSRATRRIPFLNWLVESIRDQLVTTAVRGPLSSPEVTLVQFPSARRALDDAMGNPTSDRQRRIDRLNRYSNQARERLRPLDQADPISIATPGDER